MQQLTALYTAYTGEAPKTVTPITGSGSSRHYLRFTSAEGNTIIGVIGTSVEENNAFITLARHFTAKGLPVPRVLAVSHDKLRYLQDDLGTQSLFDALSSGRDAGGHYSFDEQQLLRRTIAQLPRIQVIGAHDLDFSCCYPQPEMDTTNVLFDLNYFKYCYLKATDIDFHELRLEHDFHALASDLLEDTYNLPPTFLYRDFQARNVIIDTDRNPHFIDFQGGRRGPLQYDLVSFLWQASARYDSALRHALIDVYLDNLRPYITLDDNAFRSRIPLFVLFRTLQVLGAYGFRGYFQRKSHFLQSIPPAIDNLRQLLQTAHSTLSHYPELCRIIQSLTANTEPLTAPLGSAASLSAEPSPLTPHLSTLNPPLGSAASLSEEPSTLNPQPLQPPLTVRVFSFSYKRGIPEDTSGNGGGYVFDCRSTNNPGRYEPYKHLTGLDEPVIRFLEEDGEILTFLDAVYRLADAHVERYLQRGFTDLMFAFGCTGGQHRSVYSAQHLAEHLHRKYGIRVVLCHREQGIQSVLQPAQ